MKRVPLGLTSAALACALLSPGALPASAAPVPPAPRQAAVAMQVPPPSSLTLTAYDLGTLPKPSNVRGRDEGVSALVGGRSLWAFGDTINEDGPPRVLSSTGALNVQGFLPTDEPLDSTGYPSAPLIPLTSTELAHHQANPSQRPYVWPTGIIGREGTTSLIWWIAAIDDGTGSLRAVPGSKRAGIADVTAGATTSTRRPPIFGGEDCQWGMPVLDPAGEYVYVYAATDDTGTNDPRTSCPNGAASSVLLPNGLTSPVNMMVGRVPLSEAGTRSSYRFWNGSGWVESQLSAVPVHGVPVANVVWDEANSTYVAIGGYGNMSVYSTAPSPQGPWSVLQKPDGTKYYPDYVAPIPLVAGWLGNYAWRFHREHAGAGGAVQLVSYHHEGPEYSGSIQLLAVDSRADAATRRRAYVVRMYDVFMGFTPSSASVTYWANRLADRSLTVPEFTRQLALSTDGRRQTVRRAYQDVLGRSPSSGDLSYWAGQLAEHGWGHDILTAKLASSAEARNAYTTRSAYIDAMYRLALGRPVDSGALSYWLGQLEPSGPQSNYSFVRYLMQSHEGGQHQAQLAYQLILDRPATAVQKSAVADVAREATQIRMAVGATAEAIGLG